MSNFEKLQVWQESLELAQEIFLLLDSHPFFHKKFWLIDQMQRSAVSIPSNIAEWADRDSHKEFLHFLSIAKGSSAELKTQLLICLRLLPDMADILYGAIQRTDVIHKKISGLQKAVSRNSKLVTRN